MTEKLWAVTIFCNHLKKNLFLLIPQASGFLKWSVKFCSMPAFPVAACWWPASLGAVKQGVHGKRRAAVWDAGRQRQLKARMFFWKKKSLLTRCGGLTVQTLVSSVVSPCTNSYHLLSMKSHVQESVWAAEFCFLSSRDLRNLVFSTIDLSKLSQIIMQFL